MYCFTISDVFCQILGLKQFTVEEPWFKLPETKINIFN